MRRPLAMICLLLVLLMILYTFGHGIPDYTEGHDQEEIQLYGQVIKKEIKNDKQIIYLKNITFCNEDYPILKWNIGAVCYLESGTMPALGSFVMLNGRLSCFESARNPGGFDMKKYYASLGYFFSVRNCRLEKISDSYWKWQEKLYETREYISDLYGNIFNEKDASVMNALILGKKSEMDLEIKELYRRSGISHILSISGLHISIMGMLLLKILQKINSPLILRIILPAGLILNYCILTGMGTGSVRAMLMFIVMLMATGVSRTYDLITALSLSAFLVCCGNHYIVYSSGFWMSYLAVFGISVFSKSMIVEDEIENKKIRNYFNGLMVSISVSLFTLPVLLFSYYEYPTYSVLLNILLVPLVSILLLFGLSAGIVGMFSIKIAVYMGLPCHYILKLYEMVCSLVQSLPGNMWLTGRIPTWKIIGFYGICVFIIYLKNEQVKWRLYKLKKLPLTYELKVRVMLAVVAVLLLMPGTRNFNITMIDVGQGDGICLEYKDMTCMIDGGSSSEKELAKYILIPFFKASGIKKINYWFITHPDSDHYSGLVEILDNQDLLKQIKIEKVILPDVTCISEDAGGIIEKCRNNQLKVELWSRGSRLKYKELDCTLLHPDDAHEYEDINDYSLVMTINYKDVRMLFTGDATAVSEMEYLKYADDIGLNLENTDIYKVAHHGSTTSSSEQLLKIIMPGNVLISSGRKNKYGHPDPVILERLRQYTNSIYNTQTSGAIMIEIDSKGKIKIRNYITR